MKSPSGDKPFLLANKAYKQFTDFDNGSNILIGKSGELMKFLFVFFWPWNRFNKSKKYDQFKNCFVDDLIWLFLDLLNSTSDHKLLDEEDADKKSDDFALSE